MSSDKSNVVHGIEVPALVRHLKGIETRHDRKQAFMWETRSLSPMSRDEVKAAVFQEWQEGSDADQCA